MGHPSRNLESSSYWCWGLGDCGDQVQEALEEKNNSSWDRVHSCVLAENLAAFCPCVKILPKHKFKFIWEGAFKVLILPCGY